MNSREVASPDGVRWRVKRRWFNSRRLQSSRLHPASVRRAMAQDGSWVNGLSTADSWDGLVWLAAGLALALIIVPILLFGIELIIVGLLLAAGVCAQALLGKPWTIEARALDGRAGVHEWRVSGWRRSRRLIAQVSEDLAAGRAPAGRTPGPLNDQEPAGGLPTGSL